MKPRWDDGAEGVETEVELESPEHSIAAEEGIIGCVLNREAELKVYRRLVYGEEPFYDLRHKTIMDMALTMDDKGIPIELDSMVNELRKVGKLEAVGGRQYLCDLVDKNYAPSKIDYHCGMLMEAQSFRISAQVGREILKMREDPCMDGAKCQEKTQNLLSKLIELKKPADQKTTPDMVTEAEDQIQGDFNANGAPIGVETGLTDFDRKTHGLRPGVIILAARPGLGKSTFAMNAVEHAILDRHLSALVFSLEMSGADLIQRMIYSRSKVDSDDVMNGKLSDGQHADMLKTSAFIRGSKLKIVERTGLGVMDVRAECFDYQQKEGLDIVVVDYLQLLKPQKSFETREREVSEMSRGLKELAQDLKVPILVLAQLNRDIEKEKRKPRLSDLRESGSIEQDADMVVFLYNSDTDPSGKDFSKVMPVGAYIAKNRKGMVGTAYLTFLKKFTRFESVSRVEHD